MNEVNFIKIKREISKIAEQLEAISADSNIEVPSLDFLSKRLKNIKQELILDIEYILSE